ncbi:MAG TPA: hypothetical protein DCL77_08915 [Prolixibacteraceae bacterium]|jgi:cytochrome c oxidase subunit 4|nr:hypothetical protein [Prolixibacteraceae bacterium]
MENEKHHVVPYRIYFYILLALITFTFMSIGISHLNFGAYSVLGALIFSILKSFLVLTFFMHLKFDQPYLRFLILGVFLLFLAVVSITFTDYLYR